MSFAKKISYSLFPLFFPSDCIILYKCCGLQQRWLTLQGGKCIFARWYIFGVYKRDEMLDAMRYEIIMNMVVMNMDEDGKHDMGKGDTVFMVIYIIYVIGRVSISICYILNAYLIPFPLILKVKATFTQAHIIPQLG